MEASPTSPMNTSLRALAPDDLAAVVHLDRRITGGARGSYFERRLRAAVEHPDRHLQLAVTSDQDLVGFALGRLAGGEFGRGEALLLEAVGVEPGLRARGIGRRLMSALGDSARRRHATSLVTQADWRDHAMLAFLDRAGFTLAPRLVLERRVQRMPLPETDEEIEAAPPLVRHLRADDLEMVARVDRLLTGEDRRDYLRRKLSEALDASSIVVSLAAEYDGFVVGFALARVDLGDFGHVVPTASLDTLGVNPGFAGRGFARALLGQLIDNLAALHVEALETEVARESFGLLRFLHAFGFGPSARLSFSRPL